MKKALILACSLVSIVCCSTASDFWMEYGSGYDHDHSIGQFFLNPSTATYDFTVGMSDVSLTHMGIYDSGLDGLVSDHDVFVWDSTGLIVASTVVPQGTSGQLFDSFRYNQLGEPVVLDAGQTYVIGAWYPDYMEGVCSPDSWDPAANPHFSSVGANHALFESDSLEFPDSFNGANPMWGPTFQYNVVPEPSTWALFLCGGIALLARIRQRRKSV